jgi:hypothetical protein
MPSLTRGSTTAIAKYRQARALDPKNTSIRFNLEVARKVTAASFA